MHNSVMNVHARIQSFLQQRSVIALPYSAPLLDEHYTKAGVIPFIRANPTLYYMMKPVAKRLGLGAPGFQIGKGTRMEFVDGRWIDLTSPSPLVGKGGMGGNHPRSQTSNSLIDPPLPLDASERQAPPQGGRELEALAITALREGTEELGLKLDTIKTLYDAGPYQFASSATGQPKYMWLFTAEMTSRDMLAATEIESSTAERGWLTLSDFMIAGREDHRYILTDIAAKLETHAPR